MNSDSVRRWISMKRFSLFAFSCCLVLVWTVAVAASTITYQYHRARVVDLLNVQRSDHIEQQVSAKIQGGSGEVLTFVNYYVEDIPGVYYLDVGSRILLGLQYQDGDLLSVYLQDLARDRSMIVLAAVFALLLVLVGRLQGLRTLLTLCVAAAALVYILLPAILAGHDPILASTATAGAIALVTILVVGGWNLKSLAAILGTLSGVLVAGFLTLWFGAILELTGFTSEEAHMLRVYGGITDLRGVLFGGIILGSLGAVTDVGMSIASAAAEIHRTNRAITRSALFRSAMNVGRDIMGTMANTLILAYVGTTLPLLLLMLHLETDWLVIANMNIVAAEMLRGMAGSIGLVVSIPCTALIAASILTKQTTEAD